MPATIQVILQHDVDNVGKSGDLVKVRPGFARNFLLPRSLAVPATTAQVNRISTRRPSPWPRSEKVKKEARDLARSSSARRRSSWPAPSARTTSSSARSRRRRSRAPSRRKGFEVDRKKMHLAGADQGPRHVRDPGEAASGRDGDAQGRGRRRSSASLPRATGAHRLRSVSIAW
jgi:large subunit ribosomal protein L9